MQKFGGSVGRSWTAGILAEQECIRKLSTVHCVHCTLHIVCNVCNAAQGNLQLRRCIAKKLICKEDVAGGRFKVALGHICLDFWQIIIRRRVVYDDHHMIIWGSAYDHMRIVIWSYEDRHKKEAGIVVGKCNTLRQAGLWVLYFERSRSEF